MLKLDNDATYDEEVAAAAVVDPVRGLVVDAIHHASNFAVLNARRTGTQREVIHRNNIGIQCSSKAE